MDGGPKIVCTFIHMKKNGFFRVSPLTVSENYSTEQEIPNAESIARQRVYANEEEQIERVSPIV